MAGILCLLAFLSATTGTWCGMYWVSFGERPENFIPAGLLLFLVPTLIAHRRFPEFPGYYRVFGLLAVLLAILRVADQEAAMRKMPWGTIMMVCGVTVLIGLLERTSGLQIFTDFLTRVSTPTTIVPLLAIVLGLLFAALPSISRAAESKSPPQAEWEKTVKAAEEEGALTIYMTQAFEPVFREAFQKKFPKIKVSTVVGRGFQLGQRVMSERRADTKNAQSAVATRLPFSVRVPTLGAVFESSPAPSSLLGKLRKPTLS